MLRTIVHAVPIAIASITAVFAEKNATIATRLASLESPAIAETFQAALAQPMLPAKGEWKVAAGVLVGKELAADQHAAVLNYQKKNRNSVVRFSFKVDGSTRGFSFSLNHAKGHLFRVVLAPSSLSINLDKDKNDPRSQAVVLGTAKAKFEPGKWYTLQVEMLGDRVVAQADNGALVEAVHATLDADKPNYRFVMQGESLSIDDLYVWELK